LIKLSEQVFSSIAEPIPERDLYSKMALAFLCKQTEHARSLLQLGASRDSALIARSMIEGLAQLTWASKQPGERARRWRDYDDVHEYRALKRRFDAGLPVEPERLSRADQRARRVGMRFLTDRAERARKRSGKMPSGPYVPYWTGLDVRSLSSLAGYEMKHLTFYEQFSDWHHWGSTALLGSLTEDEPGHVRYRAHDSSAAAQALANGLQCLAVTIHLVDEHIRLNLGDDLQAIADDYSQLTAMLDDVTEG